jgi:hypothetical protein
MQKFWTGIRIKKFYKEKLRKIWGAKAKCRIRNFIFKEKFKEIFKFGDSNC